MNKLNQLLADLAGAEEQVYAAKDALMDYLKPIIVKLNEGKRVWGYYHDCYRSKDEIIVTLRDDASGGPYDRDYRIPVAVLLAADAEAAAEEFAKQQAEQAERDKRARLEAEYERLRKELGK